MDRCMVCGTLYEDFTLANGPDNEPTCPCGSTEFSEDDD